MPTVDDPGLIQNAVNGQGTKTLAPTERLQDVSDDLFDIGGTEPPKKEEKPAPKPKKDPEPPAPEPPVEEEVESEIAQGEEVEEEAEGYYADEGMDELEEGPPETPLPQTPQAVAQSDMGKWILDQLPEIQVSGLQGEKQVILNVKRAEDLPRDFAFASEYDRQIFQQAIADQTNRAYTLANQYQQNQAQQQATQFSEQEDRDIQRDIADLQREGALGRFRYVPNDRRFSDDPAVKEMQEILDFYNQENQARFQASQNGGRLYNRLSYRDAYMIYRTEHPKLSPKQEAEDTARKEASRTVARAGSGTNAPTSRPHLPRNASIDQIAAAYGLE